MVFTIAFNIIDIDIILKLMLGSRCLIQSRNPKDSP